MKGKNGLFLAALVLATGGLGLQVYHTQAAEKGGPQLLRYHWAEGKQLHYTIEIRDAKNTFASERLVDVSIGEVKDGQATVGVHTGCRNGTCPTTFASLAVDEMGEATTGATFADFPLFQLPPKAVTPGAIWGGHQTLADGKSSLDSHYKYLGLRRVNNRTLAEIKDKFTLKLKNRTVPGTRSVLLDLADGFPWRSTVHTEADETWTRS